MGMPRLRIHKCAKSLKIVIRAAWRDVLSAVTRRTSRSGLRQVEVAVVRTLGRGYGPIDWRMGKDEDAWAIRSGSRGYVALARGAGRRAGGMMRVYGLMVHEFAHLFGVGHKRMRRDDRRGHVMSVTGVGRFCRAASRVTRGRLKTRWLRQLARFAD